MSEELKPCPFCGSAALLLTNTKTGHYWGECGSTQCAAEAATTTDKAEAVAAWNTRAPDARIAAAEAERDAAVAAMLLAGKQMVEFGERSHNEGERRATAAIVAWLRDDAADGKTQFQLARAIRRGDPLKGTSNE